MLCIFPTGLSRKEIKQTLPNKKNTIAGIKKDSSWFEFVKKKAESKSIRVVSMLLLDTRDVVENLDRAKTLHN